MRKSVWLAGLVLVALGSVFLLQDRRQAYLIPDGTGKSPLRWRCHGDEAQAYLAQDWFQREGRALAAASARQLQAAMDADKPIPALEMANADIRKRERALIQEGDDRFGCIPG
ncbi:hypothetical protein [Gemmobacter serpentinus]|uniref:hypothetical protein n=1 Tax=Gemmobacter serpentinus TaxID=2652247 RepID=UPI00124DEEFD|nr:hypothetical protein [Gemmobacter serpentinus]